MQAVAALVAGFWNQQKARAHIAQKYFGGSREQSEVQRKLHDESRMFIPAPEKCEEVWKRNSAALTELARAIPSGKYGIFVDGDEQTMYILKHQAENGAQFIKAYPVSTSYEPWSNAPSSGGTPIGLHRIAEERRGMLGEIVAASKPNGTDNVRMHIPINGKMESKAFVNSLVGSGGGVAEMITSRLLLVGPSTPQKRAINIHGTNRSNLLGTRASGGCIRQSNVDVTDLSRYIEVGRMTKEGGTEVSGGTPVMIQATWRKGPDAQRPEQEKRDNVPYQKRRNLMDEID